MVLFDRQIKRLDRFLRDLRPASGKRLTRSSLIRGLLDGLIDGGVEIHATDSETELRDRIARIVRA